MKLSVRYLFIPGLFLHAIQGVAEAPAAMGAGGVIGLTTDKPRLHVMRKVRSGKVQRIQHPIDALKGYYAGTAQDLTSHPFITFNAKHSALSDKALERFGALRLVDVGKTGTDGLHGR